MSRYNPIVKAIIPLDKSLILHFMKASRFHNSTLNEFKWLLAPPLALVVKPTMIVTQHVTWKVRLLSPRLCAAMKYDVDTSNLYDGVGEAGLLRMRLSSESAIHLCCGDIPSGEVSPPAYFQFRHYHVNHSSHQHDTKHHNQCPSLHLPLFLIVPNY